MLNPLTSKWLRPVLFFLALFTLAALLYLLPVKDWLLAFNERVAQWGLPGMVVFVLVYALSAVLMIPASVLTLGAGFSFGLATGMLLVSIASTLGAALSFLVSRYLAREKIRSRFADKPKFHAVDQAVSRQGWKIVALLRLSPVFPYNVLNYILGLTGIRFSHYVLASWAGMLPGTLLYVYLGFIGKAGLETAATDAPQSIFPWVMRGLGLLATIGVTVFVTRIASKAMKDQNPELDDA